MRLMIRLLLLPAFAIAPAPLLAATQNQAKGTQYAFLVGCSQYQQSEFRPLPYTGNDVEQFRQALVQTGFEANHIVVLHDGSKETRFRPLRAHIFKEMEIWLDGLRPEDTLVVALSGHGVQFNQDPVSYFVQVDGRVTDKSTLIPLNGKEGLYERLKACKAKKKLLIVNACRNDPAQDPSFAAKKVELVDEDRQGEVPEGIAAIYSCKAGQKSFYDSDRKLAVFFDHVIRAWTGEYAKGKPVTLESFFQQVASRTKLDVNKKFGVGQVPTVMREYKGEWVIGVAKPAAVAAKPTAKAKTVELDLGGGARMKLVRIDPGRFMMGSPANEKDRNDDEFQHQVQITNPFHMGIYTVTRGQFRAFVDETAYQTDAEKDKLGGSGYDPATKRLEGRMPKYTWRFTGFEQNDEHPVVNVTWNDAKAFCKWLSDKTGLAIALPTEAQWEYACRAGTTTRYFTGNAEASLEGYANVLDQTAKAAFPDWANVFDFRDGYVFTAPVGSFIANPWGLYDMHGNVSQWCEDWYGTNFYKEAQAKTDPTGPATGTTRVLRGSCWNNFPRVSRAAFRYGHMPGERFDRVGFRVVLRFGSKSP